MTLLHLLELLSLLKLQQLHGVRSRLHPCQQVGGVGARGKLGLLLHVVAGLGGNDAELLHEFDDC